MINRRAGNTQIAAATKTIAVAFAGFELYG